MTEIKEKKKLELGAGFMGFVTALNLMFASGVLALPAGVNQRIFDPSYGKNPDTKHSKLEKSIGQELRDAFKNTGIEVVTMNNADPEKGNREWFRDFGFASGKKFLT